MIFSLHLIAYETVHMIKQEGFSREPAVLNWHVSCAMTGGGLTLGNKTRVFQPGKAYKWTSINIVQLLLNELILLYVNKHFCMGGFFKKKKTFTFSFQLKQVPQFSSRSDHLSKRSKASCHFIEDIWDRSILQFQRSIFLFYCVS